MIVAKPIRITSFVDKSDKSRTRWINEWYVYIFGLDLNATINAQTLLVDSDSDNSVKKERPSIEELEITKISFKRFIKEKNPHQQGTPSCTSRS